MLVLRWPDGYNMGVFVGARDEALVHSQNFGARLCERDRSRAYSHHLVLRRAASSTTSCFLLYELTAQKTRQNGCIREGDQCEDQSPPGAQLCLFYTYVAP